MKPVLLSPQKEKDKQQRKRGIKYEVFSKGK